MPAAEDPIEPLAENLRRFRTARGFTLDALAARAQVSRGMLVGIEQRRVNPSLGILVRLANALDVGIQEFLDLGDRPAIRVVAADERVELWKSERGGSGRLIVGSDGREHVETWDWTLEPDDRHEAEPHPTGTREILYVLEGAIAVQVGDAEPVHAHAGEAISFLSDAKHAYFNDSDLSARALMVVITPGLR